MIGAALIEHKGLLHVSVADSVDHSTAPLTVDSVPQVADTHAGKQLLALGFGPAVQAPSHSDPGIEITPDITPIGQDPSTH